MAKMILCPQCNKEKKHCARGLCKQCYDKLPDVKEKNNACKRAWRKSNPEKHNACNRAWHQANPDRVAWLSFNNNSKLRGFEGSITFEEYIERFESTNNHCYYCPAELTGRFDGLDHVDPHGKTEVSNLVPCCFICNREKGDNPNWIYRLAS